LYLDNLTEETSHDTCRKDASALSFANTYFTCFKGATEASNKRKKCVCVCNRSIAGSVAIYHHKQGVFFKKIREEGDEFWKVLFNLPCLTIWTMTKCRRVHDNT